MSIREVEQSNSSKRLQPCLHNILLASPPLTLSQIFSDLTRTPWGQKIEGSQNKLSSASITLVSLSILFDFQRKSPSPFHHWILLEGLSWRIILENWRFCLCKSHHDLLAEHLDAAGSALHAALIPWHRMPCNDATSRSSILWGMPGFALGHAIWIQYCHTFWVWHGMLAHNGRALVPLFHEERRVDHHYIAAGMLSCLLHSVTSDCSRQIV